MVIFKGKRQGKEVDAPELTSNPEPGGIAPWAEDLCGTETSHTWTKGVAGKRESLCSGKKVVSFTSYKKNGTFIKDLTCTAYKRCNPLQHLGSLCEIDPSQRFFPKILVFTDLLTVRMYLNGASVPLHRLLCSSPRREEIQDWALKTKQQCVLCSNVSLCFDNLLNIDIHFGIKKFKNILLAAKDDLTVQTSRQQLREVRLEMSQNV